MLINLNEIKKFSFEFDSIRAYCLLSAALLSSFPWNANNVSLVWIEPFLRMLEIADQFNCFFPAHLFKGRLRFMAPRWAMG